MLVILSPAKTLEFDRTVPYPEFSIPIFLDQTKELITILKKKSPEDLSKLMNISKDLAKLNHKRYQEWKTPFTKENTRQAVFTFNGPTYHGFDFFAYKKPEFERLQKTVRIISGLHGLLKPFDLIQAYRLDMETELKNPKGKNLYEFWRKTVTDAIKKENPDILVNCASKQYSETVDFTQLKCKIITPLFKNLVRGHYQVVGLLAKKARGRFADFIVRNDIKKAEDLKKFNGGNYEYDPKTSTETDLVFLRKQK